MKPTQRAIMGLALVGLLILTSTSLMAQNCDEVVLNEASRSYRDGRFRETINMLNPCLDKGFQEREKVEGYRLVALSHIALDELELGGAAVENLLKHDPLYDPSLYDLPKFIQMVRDARAGRLAVQVTSVSKKAEDLLEAPATVMVVTGDEIRTRGYQDLIDMLMDLPGFDVSKIYGATYANIYQRGFRQNNSERTLFLIDGVEENDLWTNIAYISRQYPLTNIERVEVVYGPASTMYGANAFVGVINVITKSAKSITGDEKNFGINGTVMGGSYNSTAADITIGARKDNISLTVTGRYYQSDEMDMSSDSYYDYDKAEFETIDYEGLLNVESGAAEYVRANGLTDNNDLYSIDRNDAGDTVAVRLTDAGVQQAQELDKSGYDQELNGNPVGFSNLTRDWLINAKLKIGDFSVGFQTWKREEGATPTFTDMNEAGSENGSIWVPRLSFYYVHYEKQLSEKLSISSFTRYKIHEVDESSKAVYVFNYTNGNSIADLASNVKPFWVEQYYYELSRQLRVETKMLYTPFSKLDIVSGLEIRSSQLQGNYLNTLGGGDPQEEGRFYLGDITNPANSDDLAAALEGGNQFNIRDIGFYTQGAYRLLDPLKIVIGARIDNNRVRVSDGFGTEISPRFAAVYTPGKFILKGIYSRGTQNVSNWTKYSVSDIRVPNPGLQVETIENFEVSGTMKVSSRWLADLTIYNSQISDVVGTATLPDGKVQNANIGTFNVLGAQMQSSYRGEGWRANMNYTFTNPQDQGNDLRIGDIATHQLNAGGTYTFFDRLDVNLRMNYVGERQTGEGTTVEANPDEFPAFLLFNSAISYRNLIPGMTIQLVANNLLDKTYYHPGPRSASGAFYTSRSLQRDRHFFLQLHYAF